MGRKKLSGIGFFTALTVFLLLGPKIQTPESTEDYEKTLSGTILHEESTVQTSGEESIVEQVLTIHIDQESTPIILQNSDISGPDARLFEEGDDVFVSKIEIPGSEAIYSIQDFDRRVPIYLLFGILCVLVVLISGKQGVESFLGMIFSFVVLFRLVLPLLVNGFEPVLATLAGALLIIPGTFYLSHGFERKTHVAIAGTLLTLAFTGFLAELFVPFSHLSGLADESAFYLKVGSEVSLNFRGLLLAGILISLLGILDDITISQASIAEELRKTKPGIHFTELYARCMNVGRDHIASMVNTLILVYAGGSLALMLLFLQSDYSFGHIVSIELIAQEIIHTLIGSIGLICAVPITTLLACLKQKKG